MDWESLWQAGDTGWDAGKSPPALEELVREGSLPQGKVLVPGCGAGHDVLTLAGQGRTVLGLDLAPTARSRFEQLRSARGIPAEQASVLSADFFSLDPQGHFDLVWDYTFLCALDPGQRERWAGHVAELLAPEGELITLIFPVPPEASQARRPESGPPFFLHPEQMRELLAPGFEPTRLEEVRRSHPGREGREWLGRWRRVQ
jgi:hypothetical protein